MLPQSGASCPLQGDTGSYQRLHDGRGWATHYPLVNMPSHRDFDDAGDDEHDTLWRISQFERERREGNLARPGATVFPTTVLADLRRLRDDPATDDVLQAMAAFVRHREPALMYLRHENLVWPVTLFPQHDLVHSPRDLVTEGSITAVGQLTLVSAEPPIVRPPGHWMHERVGEAAHYRPLGPLLWWVAMHGPRRTPLAEIGGRAAYRLMPGRDRSTPLKAPGALQPALQRLERESVALRDIAAWPGMSVERASRLLNGLYLTGRLLVSRTHPAARDEPEGRARP